MTETRYKFLKTEGGLCSAHGDQDWELGKWYEVEGEVKLCANGFHCSERMGQAFSYVQGGAVALVEVEGSSDSETDKEVWQRMRLVDVRQWRKEDSVALSIFAASLVLENFERLYPQDNRPRKAIEAAQKYLQDPTKENRSAAYSAYSAAGKAAYSAYSAADAAAYSADAAADAAAYSAYSAAVAAAYSAYSAAAYSAYSAADATAYSAYSAYSAARTNLLNKISDWMEDRFKGLPSFESEVVA